MKLSLQRANGRNWSTMASALGDNMRKVIQEMLNNLEKKRNIKILYACEAGSRAYGINTQTSDYDVRFIYIQKREAYLSVCDVRPGDDVIEHSVDDLLDVSGWDVRKALQLLRTSNPGLLEWLGSPIVYRGYPGDGFEDGEFADELRRLARECVSRRACMYHYYSWMRSKYEKNHTSAALKPFFYILRPILAMRVLERGEEIVPTVFTEMLDMAFDRNIEIEHTLHDACCRLAEDRREGKNPRGSEYMQRVEKFLADETRRFNKTKFPSAEKKKVSFQVLDSFFRETLDKAWEGV